VKYTALLIKHLLGCSDFHFYDGDISTGTNWDKYIQPAVISMEKTIQNLNK